MIESLFITLPSELILKALGYADFQALCALQLTCRKLRDLITNSSDLQYIVELAAAGMRDGTSHDPSFTARERLERLQAHKAAWSAVAMLESFRLETIGWYIINGDVVATKALGDDISTIKVYQMPSPLRGIDFRQWKLEFDCNVRDFYLDSTQDLLVLTSSPDLVTLGTVRVFSLSTGRPHPSCVSWSGQRNMEGLYRDVDICGDYISATVISLNFESFPTDVYLSIWNWKTGNVEAESSLPLSPRPPSKFPDVRFLDEYHILVLANHCSVGRGELGLHLQVYNFRRPLTFRGEHWELDLRCRFLLLELELDSDETLEARFMVSNAPCWSSGSREPGIFHPDRDRLLGIRLSVDGVGTHGLYIPAGILLNRVPFAQETSSFPWDVWGPRYAHVRQGPWRFQDIYGMITLSKRAGDKLVISDYHPRRVGRAQSHRERSEQKSDAAGSGNVMKVERNRVVREVQRPEDPRGVILHAMYFDGCLLTNVRVDDDELGWNVETQIFLLSASLAKT